MGGSEHTLGAILCGIGWGLVMAIVAAIAASPQGQKQAPITAPKTREESMRKLYFVCDTFRGQIHSVHRTPEAAEKSAQRVQSGARRAGAGCYLPVVILVANTREDAQTWLDVDKRRQSGEWIAPADCAEIWNN